MGCHFLLQEIFPTGDQTCLLHVLPRQGRLCSQFRPCGRLGSWKEKSRGPPQLAYPRNHPEPATVSSASVQTGPAQRAVSVLGLGGLLPEERQGVSPLRWLGNLEVGLALCEARLGSSGLAPRPAFSPLSALLWRGSPVLFGYC